VAARGKGGQSVGVMSEATSSSKRGFKMLVFIGVLCVSLCLNVVSWLGSPAAGGAVSVSDHAEVKQKLREEVLVPGKKGEAGGGKKVAVIPVYGIISGIGGDEDDGGGLAHVLAMLRAARADDAVAAVVLRVDSPGGEVTASDVLYRAVREVDQVKPVVVTMESVAASGGYFVACGGRHILANPSTLTGSIGVIMQTLNYQVLFSKLGMEMVTFRSGEMKDLLNGGRELTEKERSLVQSLVMESYELFLRTVSESRKLDAEGLRNGVADGRVISGSKALEAKLVDELGGYEEALARAKALAEVPGAQVIRYTTPVSFDRFFKMFSKSAMEGVSVRLEAPELGVGRRGLLRGRMYFVAPLLAP
jgi:protease-4